MLQLKRKVRRAFASKYTWLSCVALHALSCSAPLSTDECATLLDRYTQQLLADERTQVSAATLHAAQLAARQRAQTNPDFEFERCPDLVSRKQFDCAMQAVDLNALERCLIL